MLDIFSTEVVKGLETRINGLSSDSQPEWGSMNAAQMLAHCNVAYEMVYDDLHKKPNFIVGLMLKAFVKNAVVNDKPYKKNGQTAPAFLMKESKDFEVEKMRLFDYLQKTQELGRSHFDGKENLSFGKLNIEEWNNLFYKHLDHHLTQFGV